jgi:DNA modification methylase
MLLDSEQEYHVHLGDCIEHMPTMPDASVDFSIYSPPFPAMYAYTSEAGDIGNSEEFDNEAKLHLGFFFHQFARLLKPGRVVIVHCMQIPRMKRCGGLGLNDFRGLLIRAGERAGLVYEYDWLVRKNPQSQAIRTKSRELQFVGLESDRAKSRGCLGDYLIKFRAPGENETPIDQSGEVSRQNWIDWAEPCWMDIVETDTLNTAEAKSEGDLKHICPLQFEVIRRCVLLYTNPGEIVFSPFTGIGSEGFVSLGGKSHKTGKRIELQRRFYGCELKPEYHAKAIENLERAVEMRKNELQPCLPGFDA